MENFQPTPQGSWKLAEEFEQAAITVANAARNRVSLPACYLWAHSIELSLKAFLFAHGVPLRKLKSRDFGHDLKALVDEAREHYNLKKTVHLSNRELGEIYVLNYEYVAKHFEYHETEDYHLPHRERTKRLAEKLIRLIGHALNKSHS